MADRVRPFLEQAGIVANDPPLEAVLPLIHERLKRLSEAPGAARLLLRRSARVRRCTASAEGAGPLDGGVAAGEATSVVTAAPSFDHATLEASLRDLAANRGVKTGQLFMSLRVASTFSNVSPPLFETMEALGRERVMERLTRRRPAWRLTRPVSGRIAVVSRASRRGYTP